MKKSIALLALLLSASAEACPPVGYAYSYSVAYPVVAAQYFLPQVTTVTCAAPVCGCAALAVAVPAPVAYAGGYTTATPPVQLTGGYGAGLYSGVGVGVGGYGVGVGVGYGGYGVGFTRGRFGFRGGRFAAVGVGGFGSAVVVNGRRGGFRRGGFNSTVVAGGGLGVGGATIINTSERRGLFGRVRSRNTQVISAGGGAAVVNQSFRGRGFRR